MATLTLMIIYIAFIGLGLPDSIFGAAWPAMYQEFGLPFSYGSIIVVLTSLGTSFSSIMSVKVIKKLGTGITTAVSTGLTALALLGYSFAPAFYWICILCVPLGLGAGSVDAALNNYVANHYKASHMNFLHCFYGIGVMLSPFLMSLALKNANDWRSGYRVVFYIQIVITFICVLAIPLWKKVEKPKENEETPVINSKISDALKIKKLWWILLIFLGSCAVEYICGAWGATYVVESKGIKAETAAIATTVYYAGIAVGRFISGLASYKVKSWTIINVGQGITLLAIILIALPLPWYFTFIGLGLVGLGNGPLFPNLVHLTPEHFGSENSQSVMGLQMAAGYIGVAIMPLGFSLLAGLTTINVFAPYLFVMYGLMAVGTIVFKAKYYKKPKNL